MQALNKPCADSVVTASSCSAGTPQVVTESSKSIGYFLFFIRGCVFVSVVSTLLAVIDHPHSAMPRGKRENREPSKGISLTGKYFSSEIHSKGRVRCDQLEGLILFTLFIFYIYILPFSSHFSHSQRTLLVYEGNRVSLFYKNGM